MGVVTSVAEIYEAIAELFCKRFKYSEACQLFAAANKIRDRIGFHRNLGHTGSTEQLIDTARAALEDECFAVEWQAGVAFTIEQANIVAMEG